ncbi:EAL domain-containing protein [Pseudoalteromonas sp. N1230-9]|uniref:bifunctional diguanylate cyclase/phosphodiesterase n=1 Tax=Pseudoalteromonas sp. N1230-9 TaxID=2907156 RepID=UPI002B29F2D7|nr:EAL domain-containing protein [Pseudoalteromonas sp. N1230-9]
MKFLVHKSHHRELLHTLPYIAAGIVLSAVVLLLEWFGLIAEIPFYVAMHTSVELFSVVISFLIFAIGWNTWHFTKNYQLLLLACTMLCVAIFDSLHFLAYDNMHESAEQMSLVLNFWLIARLFNAAAFLIIAMGIWFKYKPLNANILLTSLLLFSFCITSVMFYSPQWLSAIYIQGKGASHVKFIIELSVLVLYTSAAFMFASQLSKPRANLNIAGKTLVCVLAILSETCFVVFNDTSHTTNIFNFFSHVYKGLTYFLLYKILFVETVTKPYAALENSTKQLSATLTALPDSVFELEENGTFREVFSDNSDNHIFIKGMVGKNILELFSDLDAQEFIKGLKESKRSGVCLLNPLPIAFKGRVIHFEFSITLFEYDNNGPTYLVNARDVSEKVGRVAALIQQSKFNRGLLHLTEISFQDDQDVLLNYAVEQARAITNCDGAALFICNEQKQLAYRAEHGSTFAVCTEKLQAKVAVGEAVIVNRKQAKEFGLPSDSNSFLVVPILRYGKCHMAIILQHIEKVFTVHDKNMLTVWAESVWQWFNKINLNKRMHILSQAVEQNPHPIMFTNTDAKIEYMNRAYLDMCQYDYDELIGQSPQTISAGQTDPSVYKDMWQQLKNKQAWVGALVNMTKHGKTLVEQTTIYPILDKQGKVSNYISFQHDMTKEVESETRIHQLSYFDQLTGLANQDRLKMEFEGIAKPHEDSKAAFILIGLDNFKILNKAMGIAHCNLVLQKLSARIRSFLGEHIMVARLQSDRFAFITPYTSTGAINKSTQELLRVISEPLLVNDELIVVTASIGIALYPIDGKEFEPLLQMAESAMFEVKKLGRNNTLFYAEEMNKSGLRQLQIINALNYAIEHNEFSLVFQPQIELATGITVAAEVLLRWHSEILGDVSPAEFIPIAESCGRISEIDDWVFENAVKTVRQWQESGMPKLAFAINLSATKFIKKHLLGDLIAVLQTHSVSPECIELELTETIAIGNPQFALNTITKLREAGFKMSIDDFGTGYSSMNYLKDFSLDKLKIDKSFIDDLENPSDADKAIVKAMIDLASALKMESIAEGVETPQQLNILKELECSQVQGYYFSKPLPIKMLYEFVKGKQSKLALISK